MRLGKTGSTGSDASDPGAADSGGWDSSEILGLCKLVDVAGGRIEQAAREIGLAQFLVPSRTADEVEAKLRTFEPVYADHKHRKIDRSLRLQWARPGSAHNPAEIKQKRRPAKIVGLGDRRTALDGFLVGRCARYRQHRARSLSPERRVMLRARGNVLGD